MTSGTCPISYSELAFPVPHSKELWDAQSAHEWKSLYLALRPLGQQEQPPTLIELLAEPIKLRTLGNSYDLRLVRTCLIYAVSAMVRRYRQDKIVFASNTVGATHGHSLADEVQHQTILRILDDIRASCDECLPPVEEDSVMHLISMHLLAPFDQIELVAGKEGPMEVQRVYPHLQAWISTLPARQAVWHASQVLRSLREIPDVQLSHFDVIAAYHAGLCMWVYGVLLQETEQHQAMTLASLKQEEVILDAGESIQSQRWISHDRGVPVIFSGDLDNDSSNHIAPRMTVPIHCPRDLVQVVLKRVLSRFVGMNSLLAENICHLMKALCNMSQDGDIR